MLFEIGHERCCVLFHHVPRHAIFAADLVSDRIQIQPLGKPLPDPRAGSIAQKHASAGDMQQHESILVSRRPDVRGQRDWVRFTWMGSYGYGWFGDTGEAPQQSTQQPAHFRFGSIYGCALHT